MSCEVPFLALAEDYARVRDDVRRRMDAVLESQCFVLGPESEQLESEMRAITGAGYALSCSSGSDGLALALAALDVGPGDAVIVPTFTFFATAGTVVRAGALPVFADVDETTCNISAEHIARSIEVQFEGPPGRRVHRLSGARLAAVVVVHLYGCTADMAGIDEVVRREKLRLIEDAAQAIGARGNRGGAGAWGEVGCFSFYPTKNIGGAGDGGVVTTSDAALASRIARLRVHGAEPGSHLYHECGMNARMAELQAAYINAKLACLEEWTDARVAIAEAYDRGLAAAAGQGWLRLPPLLPAPTHVYHQYVVRITTGRERVRARLAEEGIDTKVFYPLPLHLQPCFDACGVAVGDLPAAESACAEVLSLPIYPTLGHDQVEAVCDRLSELAAP